jgi:cytochrome b6-f complex iron-sulfur subunit
VDGYYAGIVDDFPPGSVTPFNAGRFYLVRQQDGGFLALYRKCTHLGCAVPWNPAEGRFVCPCHASAFEMDGQVINHLRHVRWIVSP